MKKLLQYKTNDGKLINYYFEEKNIKNLWMKINSKNEIIVVVPKNILKGNVNEFINKNIEKFAKIIENKKEKSFIDLENKYFILFAQHIPYEIDRQNNKLIFNNKKFSIKNKSINEIVENYCKKELKTYLIMQQLIYQKLMNIDNHLIFVRNKYSAWATNHVNDKKIFYSSKLAPFSKETINYVIVHELAHNKYSNHSKDFWNFVAQYEPNYKIKRAKLKKINYY